MAQLTNENLIGDIDMAGMKKRARKKMLIGGIAKGIAKGIKALKKNKGKIGGTAIVGGAATQLKKKPKAETPKKKPLAQGTSEKGRGRGAKPSKIVTDKKGNAVRSKDGKAVTFGGANKGGKKSREGRMGGGMMKKRMKRGGRAK
tara:strand:+ start:15 stop:449 length:435 start_codon:yes stop_codon:yes gene_type:complete